MESIIKINRHTHECITSMSVEDFIWLEHGVRSETPKGKHILQELREQRILESAYHTYLYMPDNLLNAKNNEKCTPHTLTN